MTNADYDDLIDKDVVLDTSGPTICIGRLVKVTADCYVLEDADVHDCTEGHSGKEEYAIETKQHGKKINRKKTYIPKQTVTAISTLEDIVTD